MCESSPCNLPRAVTARAGLNRLREQLPYIESRRGLSCSAVVGNLLSHLFKHMLNIGRKKTIPDYGRTPSVLDFSHLSAVYLTNFQSFILMSGYINNFVLGRNTPLS